MPASHVETTQLAPFEAMWLYDEFMSVKDLADKAGLDHEAVRRAVMGGAVRTNLSTADCIARALELTIDDIAWPSGLTHVGRPAQTGRPIKGVSSTALCPEHHLFLSLSGECSMCAA